MRALALIVVLAVAGCGARQDEVEEPTHELAEPLYAQELPERPDTEPIPPEQAWVKALEPGQVLDQPAICMSEGKAKLAARYVVAYNELRGLYEVDISTMDREREVYERVLDEADEEVARQREAARRSWWELHRGEMGLVIGVVVGIGLTVGVLAATEAVQEGI